MTIAHALPQPLFDLQGGNASLNSTMALPTLFHIASSKPGPHAHVVLDASSLPATQASSIRLPFKSSQEPDHLFTLWPITTSLANHADAPVLVQLRKGVTHEVTITAQPFVFLASTLLVAIVQQLACTVASAVSSLDTATLTAQTATVSQERLRASLSDSLLVGTGGYMKALPPVAEVSVCFQFLLASMLIAALSECSGKHKQRFPTVCNMYAVIDVPD
jgi:hypothetical protein